PLPRPVVTDAVVRLRQQLLARVSPPPAPPEPARWDAGQKQGLRDKVAHKNALVENRDGDGIPDDGVEGAVTGGAVATAAAAPPPRYRAAPSAAPRPMRAMESVSEAEGRAYEPSSGSLARMTSSADDMPSVSIGIAPPPGYVPPPISPDLPAAL